MQPQRTTGRRALVTGASGFLGTHLCQLLARHGVEVHAVSRREQPANPAVSRWWVADLATEEGAASVIEGSGADWVFHLASHVFGSRDLSLVLPTFRDNLATTVHLMEAATRTGCERFVLAGSLESPDGRGAPSVPSSPYAASKLAAATYASFFHDLYATPIVQARIFMVYGPGQRDLEKLVPYAALSFLRGEAPQLTGGAREVDWIFVADVVDGLHSLATAPGIEGSTLDLGSGELIRVRNVVETLRRITDAEVEPAFGALEDRRNEQVRVADAEETFRRTGFRSRVSLAEGLERTVDWCRSLHDGARSAP